MKTDLSRRGVLGLAAAAAIVPAAAPAVSGGFLTPEEVYDQIGVKWEDVLRQRQTEIALAAAGFYCSPEFVAELMRHPDVAGK